MKFSKIVVILIPLVLLQSCALWPFGKKDSENCLDDNSCEEAANPFEEQLIGGTWYCYGKNKSEPWDCSQSKSDSKIREIDTEVAAPRSPDAEPAPDLGRRVEMALNDEAISSENVPSNAPSRLETQAPPAPAEADVLAGYADDSYAVQLIALQTIDEIDIFATDHNIETPLFVRIESQGSDWYVLLLGLFANLAEAEAAANVWSTTHSPQSQPWVRPIGPLKAAAQRAREIGG